MLVACPHLPRTPVRTQRRGASLVEFAIVASVFFMIVLGILEFGRAFMVLHLLTNAAREGCRSGVIDGTSTQNITNLINSRLKDQGIKTQTVTVQINGAGTDASAAKKGDAVTVIVSVPFSDVTWMPGGQWVTGTLTEKYTLRRE